MPAASEEFQELDQLIGCNLGEDWTDDFAGPYAAAEAWIADGSEKTYRNLVREVDALFLVTESTERRRGTFSLHYAWPLPGDERVDVWLRAVRLRAAQALAGINSEPLVDVVRHRYVALKEGESEPVRSPEPPDWDPVRAQQEFLATLERWKSVPAPRIAELLDNGPDLMQQEALGGVTLLRCVGRDAAFQRLRVAEEPGRDGPTPKGSFLTLDEAEWAVGQAIAASREAVEEWGRGTAWRLGLNVPLSRPVGLVLDGEVVGPADNVNVLLVRDTDGAGVVWLAHPDLRGGDNPLYPALSQLIRCYLHEGWVYDFPDCYQAVNHWAVEVDASTQAAVVAEIDELFAQTDSTVERLDRFPTHHVWSPAAGNDDFDVWLRAVRLRATKALAGDESPSMMPPPG